jgi:hypothetical protein
MNLNELHAAIQAEIDAAAAHMAEINQAQKELETDGMYPAIPRIEWQARNSGEANYMYLVFSQDRSNGSYISPNGKRKIYIGADCKKQKAAQEMIKRRQHWERLNHKGNELHKWVSRKKAELFEITQQLKSLYKIRQNWQQYTIQEKNKATA